MLKYTIIVLISSLIGVFTSLFWIKYAISIVPEPYFHAHADFAIFISGVRFDLVLSKDEYMSTEPCIAQKGALVQIAQAHSDDNFFKDVIHLHENVGNVVHVHEEGRTWGEFFHSLDMVLENDLFQDDQGNQYLNDENKSWRFYVNNLEVIDLKNKEIQDLDRVLLTYDSVDRDQSSINNELTQVGSNACVYSGSCPQRGVAPLESCGQTGATLSDKLLNWLGVSYL